MRFLTCSVPEFPISSVQYEMHDQQDTMLGEKRKCFLSFIAESQPIRQSCNCRGPDRNTAKQELRSIQTRDMNLCTRVSYH